MINEDVLIKFSREHDGLFGEQDWIERAITLREKIRFIRDWDFQGIGLNDLSLLDNLSVKPGTRIILPGDSEVATILGQVIRMKDTLIELEIEAIGCGTDHERDPDRLLRFGTKIYPDLRNFKFILELISKPRTAAGSTYYFFSKSMRDNRLNIVKDDPELSKRMIIGSLISNLCGPDDRIRAQHMHYIRRLDKEIKMIIDRLNPPKSDILVRLYNALPNENKVKEILYERLEKSTEN